MNRGWYHESCPKFLTTIPKSGTYLIRHILRMEWPNMECRFAKIPLHISGLVRFEGIYLSPGKHHMRGHIVCTDKTIEYTKDRTSFFLFRDPRDIIVSWAYYVDSVESDNPIIHIAKDINLRHSQDRLLDLIIHLPRWFELYMGWLDQDIIPLRYEGLINNPYKELAPVAAAIPEPLDYLVARSQMRTSPTYRKAKPGNWREEFKSHHMKEFNLRWGDIMQRLGYE